MVDNNSTDETIRYIKELYPSIKILTNNKNMGYAAGNNVGIQYALERCAKYVALLNPDTAVDSRWITEAVKASEKMNKVGFVGFRVFGEYKREDEKGFRFEEARMRWKKAEIQETSHICGCALFCRGEVFQDIGLFDKNFFCYAEEDDLEKRALRAGYNMIRINIPIWHKSMGSFQNRFYKSSALTMRNTLRCSIKNDDLKGMWRQLLRIGSIACNPYSKADTQFFHFYRLRPSNIGFNAILLLYAIIWNLIRLPATIYCRHVDNKYIKRAKRRGYL